MKVVLLEGQFISHVTSRQNRLSSIATDVVTMCRSEVHVTSSDLAANLFEAASSPHRRNNIAVFKPTLHEKHVKTGLHERFLSSSADVGSRDIAIQGLVMYTHI